VAGKEWTGVIGACTGILALMISGLNAYINILRQTDELQVMTDGEPTVSLFDNGKMDIAGSHSLTFINSGSRAAAVTSVRLLISDHDWFDRRAGPNCFSRGVQFDYRIEPFSVKPGEIAVKSVDAKIDPKLLGAAFGLEPKYLLLMCLEFNVASPSDFWKKITKPMSIREFGKPKGERLFSGSGIFTLGLDSPETLMKHSDIQLPW